MFIKIYAVLSVIIDALLFIAVDAVKSPMHILILIVLLPVIFLALFATHMIVCIILSLFIDKSKPVERPNKFFQVLLNKTAELVLFVLRYKTVENGKEIVPTDKRFLLVSNHLSGFDPITTIPSLQKHGIIFVSKPENLKIILAGSLMHICGYLPIDRDNPRSSMRTLHKCVDIVKNDIASVGIYPEGHRSKTGELQDFKDGVFYVAKKAKCPVVVMTVKYSKRKLYGKTVYLDYKAVLLPESFADKTTHDISEEVRNIMLEK